MEGLFAGGLAGRDTPSEWLEARRFMLLATLLPTYLHACDLHQQDVLRLPTLQLPPTAALQHALTASTAERFRRQEAVHAKQASSYR